ncbi:hypothetical protein DU33_12175 [Methanosarcina mazei]|nr:hypothetical protein DU33_12175 [Methanosarcina mazei]KKG94864.1 hypothetical protein DU66_10955 [Methanosarcina mazei]
MKNPIYLFLRKKYNSIASGKYAKQANFNSGASFENDVKESKNSYFRMTCDQFKTILLYMGKNYCINYGRLSWEFPIRFETEYSVFKRPRRKF